MESAEVIAEGEQVAVEEEAKEEPRKLTKAEKKKMNQKKNKLFTKANEELAGGEFSAEQATDLAEKYMAIADIDGNGTLDLNEFQAFVKKLTPTEGLDEGSVEEVFTTIDTDGDGQLTAEEFG
mmetsp:Transcript_28318/g.42869  ORF Transcript_28318/g.42869 Transcript_28318/m.42869 type:complete len:123 (+) Transcript_28318:252-620(+)